jgi:hypothetical protein
MKTRPFGQECNIKQIQFIEKVFITEQNLQTDKTIDKTYRRTDTSSQPSCTRAVSGRSHCDCAIFKNLFSTKSLKHLIVVITFCKNFKKYAGD